MICLPISIDAGQFKIYGNQQALTLSTIEVSLDADLALFPNPTNNSFKLNKNTVELKIYSISGKLIKEYKGEFTKNTSFNISDLPIGMYLIKAKNMSGQLNNTKLIKF